MSKFRLFISAFLIIVLAISGRNGYAQENPIVIVNDTTALSDSLQDLTVDEVINSATPPPKQDIKHISEVTRYGFKDLFKNYVYNPAMPYAAQVNPSAEQYMQDYLKSYGRHLERLKASSISYFNYIDGILSQYGLPRELKYLAVIESDLKSTALSAKGARGPWQFMPSTARGYGLQVNPAVDDRIDYYKSTNAAAKYLLTLYKNLKDWLLVIAAYNGGPGRVYSAIRQSGSRNFWDLQYYLPEESRNHVKKFIATHYIMESGNSSALGENGGAANLTPAEDSAALSKSVTGRYKANIIAKHIKMEPSEFSRYNPGFDNILATGSSYNLRLPPGNMEMFEQEKSAILRECVDNLLGEVLQ